MTIKEAALEVMREKGEPMTVREIYDQIILRKLYKFNSNNHENIVRRTIRIQCEGMDHLPISKSVKIFRRLEDGRYEPASK